MFLKSFSYSAVTVQVKLFLAAFDVRSFNPDRVLFVVHRETILKDALKTFKYVLKNDYTYGYLTGTEKDYEADILFATNLTLSKNIDKFKSYDILITLSLMKFIMQVLLLINQSLIILSLSFLLGLTATPEEWTTKMQFLICLNIMFLLKCGLGKH